MKTMQKRKTKRDLPVPLSEMDGLAKHERMANMLLLCSYCDEDDEDTKPFLKQLGKQFQRETKLPLPKPSLLREIARRGQAMS